MTREEAIGILCDLYNYYNDKDNDSYAGFDEEDNEAIDLAIKALKHPEKNVIQVAPSWYDIPSDEMTLNQAQAAVKELRQRYAELKSSYNSIKTELKPCEDAISRQAVINGLASIAKAKARNDAQKSMMGRSMFFVEQLPTVTCSEKANRSGEWIEYTRVLIPEPINKWEQAWYCSECGYGNQDCEDGSAWLEWKWCPNCGCKMGGME